MHLNQFLLTVVVPLTLFQIGCSSLGKSVGLGGGIGAGAGAVLGGIADPGKNGQYRTRNVVLGSALGGIAGMATASAIHGMKEEERSKGFRAGKMANSSSLQGMPPDLRDPKVETHWVEGRVIGNRYIEGHFEYVIVEPTKWAAE